MEKTVNLKLPGAMELGREELKEVEGGDLFGDYLLGKLIDAAIDAWVDTSIYLIQGRLDHPEYYEGVPQHL